jgi:hypothetical protein
MQPEDSREPIQLGREPVMTRWRLFTASAVEARERIEWQNRLYDVIGDPNRWIPRFGRVHFECHLTHVSG